LTYRLRRGQPRSGLIVMLHGLSGDENAMWIFEPALPRAAAVIAPRAPYASEFGGYSWTPAALPDELTAVDFREAADRLQQFIGEAVTLHQVDPRRVIVMGFSQGAALSYAFSLAHPGMLCGVIALAGFLPQHNRHSERSAAESKSAFPRYLIVHGTHDEAVPIEQARAARLVFKSRGAPVEYHEHRVGHKVSAQGMREIKHWIDKTWQEC
jgi:phospholipase/carboxylesterase